MSYLGFFTASDGRSFSCTLVVIVLLSFGVTIPVEGQEQGAPHGLELYIELVNNFPSSKPHTFKISSVGTTWDKDFQISSIPGGIHADTLRFGVNHVTSTSQPPYLDIGYGKYRIEIDGQISEDSPDGVFLGARGSFVFYVDFTDCNYPNYNDGLMGDMDFTFDVSTGTLTQTYPAQRIISSGETVHIWDFRYVNGQARQPAVCEFQPAVLNITASQNPETGILEPVLSWVRAIGVDYTSFRIYRSINVSGGPPGTFYHLATVSSVGDCYRDAGLAAGTGWKVYYRISGVVGGLESAFSNLASIDCSGFYKADNKNRKTRVGMEASNEIRINADTTVNGYRFSPAVAASRSAFVSAWVDPRDNDQAIFLQRFSADGSPLGSNAKVTGGQEFKVGQDRPAIASDSAGNIAVVWEDNRNGNWDIYLQRFTAEGTPIGINVKVNDDGGVAHQYVPAVAFGYDGSLAVTWEDERTGFNQGDIMLQRYDAAGNPIGTNLRANTDTGTAKQSSPSIAPLPDGGFVIVWEDFRNGAFETYLQRYDASGSPLDSNIRVNDNLYASNPDETLPSVAVGKSSVAVAWHDYRNGSPNIYLQRFDREGKRIGTNVKVNDAIVPGTRWSASVALGVGDKGIVVWEEHRSSGNAVYARRFDSSGAFIGTQYPISEFSAGANQYGPSLSSGGDLWFCVWMDTRRTAYGDILGRFFTWDWSGVTSAPVEKNAPAEYVILQSYPNPFNPSTTISYTVPLRARVRLHVFDLLGRLVDVLAEETVTAGIHHIVWNAKVPGGIYFCRLDAIAADGSARQLSATTKMILLK